MNKELDAQTVRHIGKLACIELNEEEIEKFSSQLSAVAGHFADMDDFDTSNVEPATHARDIRNVFREDKVEESLTPSQLLNCAPASEENMFMVPKILEEQ